MKREWSTPVSIVIGSAIVSVGVYYGLRSTPPARDPVPTTARAESTPSQARQESPFAAARDRHRAFAEDDPPPIDDRSPSSPSEPPRERPVPTEADLAMAVAAPLPSQSGASAEVEAQISESAAEAFEAIRDDVRDQCWDALPEDPDAPSSIPLELSLSYDPDGNVIASGVSEDHEVRRDGVAGCLGPLVHQLKIPAPGARASVSVRITIP